MTLDVWTKPSGYSLGIFEERVALNIPLPANSVAATYTIITGSLPAGLRLSGKFITGTAFEVSSTLEYRFVIRASNGTDISDRTFYMTMVGADNPNWVTPSGLLPIGENQAYYILDNSYVDFQLSAIDTDTSIGDDLSFFISSNDGELPPGLTLTRSGRIVGFIQPLLAVPRVGDTGFYDVGLYDGISYDFGFQPGDGFDSYVFDLLSYNENTIRPRKLNRNYEFAVSISDGETISKRKFRIYVVGDDYFRANSTILQSGSGTYTADATYVRTPIFTTPKNLGIRRANNYQTFKIDIFDGFDDLGPVLFELSKINTRISAVSQKDDPADNRFGYNLIRIVKTTGTPKTGDKLIFDHISNGKTSNTYEITGVDILGGDVYRVSVFPSLESALPNNTVVYIGDNSKIPEGMSFDPTTGEVFGVVPYQPAITQTYFFTIKATRYSVSGETSSSRRIFTVDILGEIDSTINWVTANNLGTIDVGFPSTFNLVANSTIFPSIISYDLTSGVLPPGLKLAFNGEIVGKVSQLTYNNTYKSYWKPNTNYIESNIVKRDNIRNVISVIRRKNIASIVTSSDHGAETGDIVKINTLLSPFNYINGVLIQNDILKLLNASTVEIDNQFHVTFSFSAPNIELLAPSFTLFSGIAHTTMSINSRIVNVKSTSGQGVGAIFKIDKSTGSTVNYRGLTTVTLINPGVGYLPGDTVTISGVDLDGVDIINDFTFTIGNGIEFYYKINGNGNLKYNIRTFAIRSTPTSITLSYPTNPGIFGNGLINVASVNGTYEAQTQLVPMNYFNYTNKGTLTTMLSTLGNIERTPEYVKCINSHTSTSAFQSENWEPYSMKNEGSITTFDKNQTKFTNLSIDREFKFTVTASDRLVYSAVQREFLIKVETPNAVHYSNITARPLLKPSQRSLFSDFINNTSVFDSSLIYRVGDVNFGIRKDLSTLIFAGIETATSIEYANAMKNNRIKRFKFGNVKSAVAKIPGTNIIQYEVVYVELLDPLEIGKKYLPIERLSETLPNVEWQFPSSISIWRKRIRALENRVRERNYLPLWMRSIQAPGQEEIDFTLVVPLCYCNPGAGESMVLNIKNSGFDFKLLDYTIDRYIIDAVDGYYKDKYLAFNNQ